MAVWKPFASHSTRWQREKKKQGVSPQKYDAWSKLSPSTKKQTDPIQYGAGKSVRDQLTLSKKRKLALEKMLLTVKGHPKANLKHIRQNVKLMDQHTLDVTLNSTPQEIREMARQAGLQGRKSLMMYK